ncbi:hypothetical protein FA95DRAFT_1407987 [Auriscalpium vulgare]|uniref:Uncharacterized protein n=2 Tax=Auriscalpium vulgare TaxID=40419 RepID=A0ACB8R0S7_9AGAM|nr:hypothetical protein FA95DRAFT_1408020 [Auriscalpium vulgare]KAI0037698.1 hypothetical protein FA95DRAFT_1407987 [Auriscalpium vulgare]
MTLRAELTELQRDWWLLTGPRRRTLTTFFTATAQRYKYSCLSLVSPIAFLPSLPLPLLLPLPLRLRPRRPCSHRHRHRRRRQPPVARLQLQRRQLSQDAVVRRKYVSPWFVWRLRGALGDGELWRVTRGTGPVSYRWQEAEAHWDVPSYQKAP